MESGSLVMASESLVMVSEQISSVPLVLLRTH